MERVRFGIFAFSPSTGELWRDGVAVKLQAQPARVLAALAARAGQVVSRDTLQREVWGEGTHVDFDRGLNFCIAQVRSALGDSAESPRFIETVPKQGYRFIAPIAAEPPASPGGRGLSPSRDAEPRPRRPSMAVGAGAVLLVIFLLVVAAFVWARVSRPLPAVIVVPFYNETGRTELGTLARALSDVTVASLAAPERKTSLSVIGNADALRNPFARTDVQGIARDLQADWVLIGQLQSDGSGLRLVAHLIRATDMKHVWARTYDDAAFARDAQTRTAEAIADAVVTNLSSDTSR